MALVGSFYKRHAVTPLRAPTGRKRTVSGLFHSPRRGAFHRSLTVLVHCRSSTVFSLGPWSALLHARYLVPGATHATTHSPDHTPPTGLSPAPAARSSGLRHDVTSRAGTLPSPPVARSTPVRHRRQAVPPPRFGLLPFRSPLLRESSLFLRVLRCFSSPGAPRLPSVPGHHAGRVAPFGFLRFSGCQRLPGAFRRVAASFFGRRRQGIHHAPFFAAMTSSLYAFRIHTPDRLAPESPQAPVAPCRGGP